MRTFKREYLDILMQQKASWLRASVSSPSQNMKEHPVTIALHLIAIRRKEGQPKGWTHV